MHLWANKEGGRRREEIKEGEVTKRRVKRSEIEREREREREREWVTING